MKPLQIAAFCTGLCPVGSPPSYKPSWKNVTYGLVVSMGWIGIILSFLGVELFAAYDIKLAIVDFVHDLSDNSTELERTTTAAPTISFLVPINTTELNETSAPTLPPYVESQLIRVMTVSSGASMIISILGLLIGYFRKIEHLPDVFRLGDELPGKARWKTALFVVELSVYTLPVSAYLVKAYFESRGLSHVDAFAFVGMLMTVEKLMILHLVARVGTGFDVVNRRLEAMGDPQSKAAKIAIQKTRRRSSYGFLSPVSEALIDLRELHLDFFELLERVVRAYEVQILAFIVSEFVTAVLTIYMEARNVYLNTLQPMDMLALLFLALITQVTTLLYGTCRSTSAKGNATTGIVHKLINLKRFSEEEVEELMLFSMQLSHTEVSVSPYDMVTLDYSLLHSVMASVAMHVVILVQFNLSTGSS